MRSGHDLVTRQHLDSLWDMAVARVSLVLADQFALFQDPEHFRRVKYMVLMFSRALERYCHISCVF